MGNNTLAFFDANELILNVGQLATLCGALGCAWHNVDNSKFIQDLMN
jgi:hypothetical protein